MSAQPATTIFERMSAAAARAGAINLGQGFPQLPEPAELISAAQAALGGHSNQYPPMRGLPALRDGVAAYYRAHQGADVAGEDVVVTSGATEALAAAIGALIGPGDEAILVQPLYDAYKPLVEWAGGKAVLVDLAPPAWSLPVNAVAAAITPATRAIVINTPNNPTGTLLPREALDALGALCVAHDIVLISDEVWEATVWGGGAIRLGAQRASLARSDHQDRFGRQDLCAYGVEGGLGGGRAASGRKGGGAAPVPNLYHGNAPAMGGGRRAGLAAGLARGPRRSLCSPARAAGGGVGGRGLCRAAQPRLVVCQHRPCRIGPCAG